MAAPDISIQGLLIKRSLVLTHLAIASRSSSRREIDTLFGIRAGTQTDTPPLGQRSMQGTFTTCSSHSGCSLLCCLIDFFSFASRPIS
jgi:hypothetical protein